MLVAFGDGRMTRTPAFRAISMRLLHLAVLQLVVGLEVQDLVVAARRVDRAELVLQRRVRDGAAVEEEPARLIDAEDDFVVLSGLRSRFFAFGSLALKPAAMSGVTIMKMISSTSMMSIIGTTFGSDLTDVCPACPTAIAWALLPVVKRMPASARHGHCR